MFLINHFDQSCHLLFDLPLHFQAQIFSTCILVDADGYEIAIQQARVDGPAHEFQQDRAMGAALHVTTSIHATDLSCMYTHTYIYIHNIYNFNNYLYNQD